MMQIKLFEIIISSALFGIIWVIQILQYPGFLDLNRDTFKLSMKHHQDRISFVVIPLMLSELFITGWLIFTDYSTTHLLVFLIVLGIWGSTFTLQVPLHEKLLKEVFHEERIKKLVKTNWIRTFLWTAKLAVILI
jgi:hypothetical protein